MNEKYMQIYNSLKNRDFDSYINLLEQVLPKTVCWYCEHNNQNINSLINKKIPLSNPKTFNDPFDSLSYTIDPQIKLHKNNFDFMIRELFANSSNKVVNELLEIVLQKNILSSTISYIDKYKILKTELSNIKTKYNEIELITVTKSTPWLNQFYSFTNKSIFDFVSDSGIACFSENKNDLVMWAHYGRSCSGLCIEYSTNDIINYIKKNSKYFFIPIIYNGEIYADVNYSLSDETRSYMWNVPQFMCKHTSWEYEKEWRIIVFEKDEFEIESFDIKSITLGYNFSIFNKYIENKPGHDEQVQINEYIRFMKFAEKNKIKVYQIEPENNVYKIWLR